MQVCSFVRKGIDLEAVEIEVSLVPGIPIFHLIGLPDTSIKESIMRIKSALRHQGFKLPKNEQVIFHLKPSHEKKSSQGLDLALAAAYLWKTNQLRKPQINSGEKFFLYGEVSLEGQVAAPQDLELLENAPENSVFITGEEKSSLNFQHGRVNSLRDLDHITWCEGKFSTPLDTQTHSRYEDFKFSPLAAELLAVTATGEHNIFLAGPAGTGKTTFSEALHSLLRLPTPIERRKIEKISRITGCKISGRPLISPHHSSSEIALLGGGVPPQPGEITRAQHGVLVLDEFLEFKHAVKESLREPIEKHEMTVSRAGARVTFPADFLLVGTSNLCPCGDYAPNKPVGCGFHSTYCKSYYKRLSGPLLDRFEIVAFSHEWSGQDKIMYCDIHKKIRVAQEFAKTSRGQEKMNSRLSLKECEDGTPSFVRRNLLPERPASHRRLLALYRVARTFADLEESPNILGRHIEKAKNLTIQPFREMKEAWR
ncbi:MAG: hypothetical protein A2Z20_07390 [Bdellovibrionales bacterium RBG_16_40_8]|nr:MAG: hypothetical protein A2Z20_07390 [Bdellovibrionales bacterium RBG_16_40_8]